VNISFGYDVGNLLLQSVAQRLQKLFHLNCTIFHIEGDQFVILVQDIAICFNDAFCTVESIGNRILRHLAEPHILDRRVYCCTTRIGVTLFRPEGQSAEAVVQRAELALRQAKVDGAALLRFFDATMQSDIVACTSLEADLRKALLRREFYLHYQPIVDASGDQRGVEALLRWTHPTRGAVRPDEFIAVAEKTGLMLQIGQWVLKHGCRVLAQLAGQASTAHYTVAINVSALQLRQPDFVCMVMSALQSTGAPPDRLKLELTESMLLEDVNQVVEKMRALRDVGVTFYLDDFGTGYSSFSYLKALPLSHLKIDRSFIQDVTRNAGDAAIVRSLITLAKCLGLDVVAEGVETKEQFEFLRDNGCTFFQGYLFGRPAPLPFTGFTPDAS
jgi:diguanylate cyclase (GGDEF)-like protein